MKNVQICVCVCFNIMHIYYPVSCVCSGGNIHFLPRHLLRQHKITRRCDKEKNILLRFFFFFCGYFFRMLLFLIFLCYIIYIRYKIKIRKKYNKLVLQTVFLVFIFFKTIKRHFLLLPRRHIVTLISHATIYIYIYIYIMCAYL